VVHLHYFAGACDWWVVELNSIERPGRAFGFVCLGDPAMAEWGYIDPLELASIFRPPSFGYPVSGGTPASPRRSSSSASWDGRPGRRGR
jgi:hypothetical protein